ncbi:unnamed protein product [Linum trigynum]|uniref:Uncharacterized protein n=1 Tax=Linum trigynum TaxID=586398 RepID=A0AAV2FTR0_9ROSI
MSDYKKDLRRKYFVVTGEEPNEEMMEKITSRSGGVELMLTAAAAAKGRNTGDLQREERHQAVLDRQRSLTNLYDGCTSLRLHCWETDRYRSLLRWRRLLGTAFAVGKRRGWVER